MKLYAIIRKPMFEGFLSSSKTHNPSRSEISRDLAKFTELYLLSSLDDSKEIAKSFFWQAHPPKTTGGYGVIAEVTVEFPEEPAMTSVDSSALFNSWVDSQPVNWFKQEVSGVNYNCVTVSPKQIKSISHSYISDEAKAINKNLQDTDFANDGLCLMM